MTRKNQTRIIAEPGKQGLVIIREFDAPRELVFKAFTTPELLVQWFLPKELEMKVDFMSCKTGGSYRHFHTHTNGTQFGFFGVFHEVLAPERIIKTSEFEGLPEKGQVILETTLFEALPHERTRVTIQSVCQSEAYRDAMINSGMEVAVTVAHNQLDELLAKG